MFYRRSQSTSTLMLVLRSGGFRRRVVSSVRPCDTGTFYCFWSNLMLCAASHFSPKGVYNESRTPYHASPSVVAGTVHHPQGVLSSLRSLPSSPTLIQHLFPLFIHVTLFAFIYPSHPRLPDVKISTQIPPHPRSPLSHPASVTLSPTLTHHINTNCFTHFVICSYFFPFMVIRTGGLIRIYFLKNATATGPTWLALRDVCLPDSRKSYPPTHTHTHNTHCSAQNNKIHCTHQTLSSFYSLVSLMP